VSSAEKLIPESPRERSRAQHPARAEFASERRNGTALRCHPVQMGAADAQDWSGEPEDDSADDLADMLEVGWHVTVCAHCGGRIEHTTTNPAFVEIAEAIHALGHCT
jgi:hypothetical protein